MGKGKGGSEEKGEGERETVTIDERLDALTMNLELVSRNQEAMQTTQAAILEDHGKMQSEIRVLLVAQVAMSEAMTKLAEAQTRADTRMDALILTVDQVIRRVG